MCLWAQPNCDRIWRPATTSAEVVPSAPSYLHFFFLADGAVFCIRFIQTRLFSMHFKPVFFAETKHVKLSPLRLQMFRLEKPKLENWTKASDGKCQGNGGRKTATEKKGDPDGSINFIHHFSPSKKLTEEQIHLSLPHRNMKLVPVTYFFFFKRGFSHSLWYGAFVPLLSLCNGPFSLLARWMKTNRRVRSPCRSHRE